MLLVSPVSLKVVRSDRLSLRADGRPSNRDFLSEEETMSGLLCLRDSSAMHFPISNRIDRLGNQILQSPQLLYFIPSELSAEKN